MGFGRILRTLRAQADALPQPVVRARRPGAAAFRLGHPRPASLHRPQARDGHRQVLFAAIILVAIAVALVMTPAAIHRQTQQRAVSERFLWLSSTLVLASMFPLALGLCLDVYLIGRLILESGPAAALVSAVLLCLFL